MNSILFSFYFKLMILRFSAFDYGFVIHYNSEEGISGKGSGMLFRVLEFHMNEPFIRITNYW